MTTTEFWAAEAAKMRDTSHLLDTTHLDVVKNNIESGDNSIKEIPCNCKAHSKAKNFKELIELVKDAEYILIQNKLTEVGDRINCIRGIYYGAEWSLDFQQERSSVRNKGFAVYTGYDVKYDARKVLKCSNGCKGQLFEALYNSPEVTDNQNRVTDFGHLMIGLDARRAWSARNFKLPYGGTGLENVTWLGDIGGGAGMLAYKRTLNPKLTAKSVVFDSLHDYGCSVNIEGDIAGYVVGLDLSDVQGVSNPTNQMKYIHVGLKDFFDNVQWTARVGCFIGMIGGKIDSRGLTNGSEWLNNVSSRVEDFAKFYITTRAMDKSFDKKQLAKSFRHIKGCAKEVSTIFLNGLLDLKKHPNLTKYKAVTDVPPTPMDNTSLDSFEKAISEMKKYLGL